MGERLKHSRSRKVRPDQLKPGDCIGPITSESYTGVIEGSIISIKDLEDGRGYIVHIQPPSRMAIVQPDERVWLRPYRW